MASIPQLFTQHSFAVLREELVCPFPRSLATTSGISVDVFSSPYLDVSVQAVPRVHLFDSMHADSVLRCRVSPFGNLRIEAYLQLPEAYRSLSRPSSAPDAKAFPLRSFLLDLRRCLDDTVPFPAEAENCTASSSRSFSKRNPLRWAFVWGRETFGFATLLE